MFFRLLMESFRRQRRRKLLAGIAILLGTTAVTAMLALATSIGDRIHQELAVYGANIIVTPAAVLTRRQNRRHRHQPRHRQRLPPRVRPRQTQNHLLGQQHHRRQPGTSSVSWRYSATQARYPLHDSRRLCAPGRLLVRSSFQGTSQTGAPALHPWWKLEGRWPVENQGDVVRCNRSNALRRSSVCRSAYVLLQRFHLKIGDGHPTHD